MSQSASKLYENTIKSEKNFEENIFTFIENISEGNK